MRRLMQATAPASETSHSASMFRASLFIAGALIGVALTAGYFIYNPSTGATKGDQISDTERKSRAVTLAMLGNFALQSVSDEDKTQALRGMQLSDAARETLIAELAHGAATPTTDPIAHASAIRLAWITLWDSDTEDGDTLRLDSQDYSRIVTLRHDPVTFAIPVTASGNIRLTGIKDGKGGGITAALASGPSQKVLIILNEGQSVNLKTKLE